MSADEEKKREIMQLDCSVAAQEEASFLFKLNIVLPLN